MHRYLFLIYIIGIVSCGIFDAPEKEPGFIHFKDSQLKQKAAQGGNTHKILDLWIDIDAFDLGLFSTPNTVPLIPQTDDPQVFIFAGIRNNGIAQTPVKYPFYKLITIDWDYVPQNLDSLELEFEYEENINFRVLEGFESNHIFTKDQDEDANTELEIITGDAAVGAKFGRIKVDEETPQIKISTILSYSDFPTSGNSSIYMELDHRNNTTFGVGLVGVVGNEEFEFTKILITPKEDWNKIYIDFTDDIRKFGVFDFHLFFILNNDASIANSFADIDNIKLLHF